jgi:DNA-binding response OmpR family regulator
MDLKGKLLIVDDDADILCMMKLILSGKGYIVNALNNGDVVQSHAEQFQPDVIILDMLLSGKDGRMLSTKLKESENTRHIPVIMISAHPGAKKACLNAGANEFLSKPFNLKDLFEKIEICLRKEFQSPVIAEQVLDRRTHDEP